MIPFPWFWWNIHFPFSGDVTQDISPETVWDLPFSGPYMGNRELERKILADGAGYGEQLKLILNALSLLLEKQNLRGTEAGKELLAMKAKIEAVKEGYHKNAADHARDALKKLQEKDAKAYAALVKELK